MASARELLGPSGPFAASLPGYEARSGQVDVAVRVERLLREDGVLICEAGTGIGKTFAYLVPAILSGRKVVISTATKNLQDQIAERDLPRVLDVLGLRVEVAVMKGLSNYLCRRRYKEFVLSEEGLRPGYARDLELVRGWMRETETGALGELASLEERARVRLEIASSSDTRIGANCPEYEECFVTEMRRAADAAQIVIVNHHLFFADLALRGPHPGRVLPDYDAVLFDEAHQIEDTAALFFGVRITRQQLERLEREAERVLRRASLLGGPLDKTAGAAVLADLLAQTKAFFEALLAHLPAGERTLEFGGRVALPVDVWKGAAGKALRTLDRSLEDVMSTLRSRASVIDDASQRELLEQTARRAEAVREGLEAIVSGAEGRVTWLDVSPQATALSSTPVDLSSILRDRLFDTVPAVGLLSATLSTSARPESSGFGYVKARLGLGGRKDVEELSVPSPFAYDEQCLLYLPSDLPPVSDASFVPSAIDRVAELIEIVGGGAFVLTTSLSAMRRLYEGLVKKLPSSRILIQGQKPKDALVSEFRANGHAVLVATSSFWEGVDVPGHALRLVVLEKVPFAVPTDPVFQARGQALEEKGLNSFVHLALPSAAIALKQGFGRLIRRTDDRGIVALLDERVLNKSYGKRLLAALPPARRTSSLADVRSFAERMRY